MSGSKRQYLELSKDSFWVNVDEDLPSKYLVGVPVLVELSEYESWQVAYFYPSTGWVTKDEKENQRPISVDYWRTFNIRVPGE